MTRSATRIEHKLDQSTQVRCKLEHRKKPLSLRTVLFAYAIIYSMLPCCVESRLVKVTRLRDGRNRFYLDTAVCNFQVCDKRNSYLVKHQRGMCGCQCNEDSVYAMNADTCLYAGADSGSYVIGHTVKKIGVFSPSKLRRGGLSITYCPDSHCVGNEVSKCKIDFQQSVYDDVIGWMPLWNDENRVDFVVTNGNNQIKLKSNSSKYNGKVLKISMKCDINGLASIRSFTMFAVTGEYMIPTTPLPTNDIPSSASKTESKATSTSTETGPILKNKTTVIPLNPTITTTSSSYPVPVGNIIQNQESKEKRIPKEQKQPSSTGAITGPVSDSSKMMLIIVTVLLGAFLIITCVLLACFYKRWRRAKQRAANQSNEPPFFIQSQTPVFLIGRDGKDRRRELPSHFTNDLNESQRSTASDSNLYSHTRPVAEKKNNSSIRHLYASIDKFLKLGNSKNKSNGSLDEGYTTDDNYDYRRFAAFPKDLYDEPGSIVSSTDEPEFRIPEDFITSQMSITKTHMDDDEYLEQYRSSSNVNISSSNHQIHNASVEERDVIKSPYDFDVETLPRRERATTNPYDEIGEVLTNKVNDLRRQQDELSPSRDDDSSSPDEVGLNVIENINTAKEDDV